MATTEQPKKITGGAFGRFLAENRSALTQECQGKPVTAVVKLASERFKTLGDPERASYEEKFKQAVQQYEKDMEAFVAAGGVKKAVVKKEKDQKKAVVKKEKDQDAPKKPVGGAYGVFSNEKREEFTKAVEARGEKGFGPVAKMTSEAFKTLGDAERAPYAEKYTQNYAAYKEALAAYMEKKAAEQPIEKPATPEESPEKKRGRQPTTSPSNAPAAKAAKRGRKAAESAPVGPVFEASVVAAAEKEGLTSNLSNLAARPAILAKGLEPMELLKALMENGGLVNKAQTALLGGA